MLLPHPSASAMESMAAEAVLQEGATDDEGSGGISLVPEERDSDIAKKAAATIEGGDIANLDDVMEADDDASCVGTAITQGSGNSGGKKRRRKETDAEKANRWMGNLPWSNALLAGSVGNRRYHAGECLKSLDHDSGHQKQFKAYLRVWDACVVVHNTRHGDRIDDADLKKNLDTILPKFSDGLPAQIEVWLATRDGLKRAKVCTTAVQFIDLYMRAQLWVKSGTFDCYSPQIQSTKADFNGRLNAFVKVFVRKALGMLIGDEAMCETLLTVVTYVAGDCELMLTDPSHGTSVVTYLSQLLTACRAIRASCFMATSKLDSLDAGMIESLEEFNSARDSTEGRLHILQDLSLHVLGSNYHSDNINKILASKIMLAEITPKLGELKAMLNGAGVHASFEGRLSSLKSAFPLAAQIQADVGTNPGLVDTTCLDSLMKSTLGTIVKEVTSMEVGATDPLSHQKRATEVVALLRDAAIHFPFDSQFLVWQGDLSGVLRSMQKNEKVAVFNAAMGAFSADHSQNGVTVESVKTFSSACVGLAGIKLNGPCLERVVRSIELMTRTAMQVFPATQFITDVVGAARGLFDKASVPACCAVLDKLSNLVELDTNTTSLTTKVLVACKPDLQAAVANMELIAQTQLNIGAAKKDLDYVSAIQAGVSDDIKDRFRTIAGIRIKAGDQLIALIGDCVVNSHKDKLKEHSASVGVYSLGAKDRDWLRDYNAAEHGKTWKAFFKFGVEAVLNDTGINDVKKFLTALEEDRLLSPDQLFDDSSNSAAIHQNRFSSNQLCQVTPTSTLIHRK